MNASSSTACSTEPPPNPPPSTGAGQRVLLITGMSGGGKTAALQALLDLGYETMDHLPLSLLSRILPGSDDPSAILDHPLAVGVHVRKPDFSAEPLLSEIDRLGSRHDLRVALVFLDCNDTVILNRFTASRHRHPLADDRPIADAVARERDMTFPLKARADLVVDTTHLTLSELKRILEGNFGLETRTGLHVFVSSFSFRLGIPRDADLVFDVRFLRNPFYDPQLRPLTGQDQAVCEFIRRDEGFAPFFTSLVNLLTPLLPRYAEEGKSYLTIAIGCTGGRHRSVFTAEQLAAWFEQQGQPIRLQHRDVERSSG